MRQHRQNRASDAMFRDVMKPSRRTTPSKIRPADIRDQRLPRISLGTLGPQGFQPQRPWPELAPRNAKGWCHSPASACLTPAITRPTAARVVAATARARSGAHSFEHGEGETIAHRSAAPLRQGAVGPEPLGRSRIGLACGPPRPHGAAIRRPPTPFSDHLTCHAEFTNTLHRRHVFHVGRGRGRGTAA